MIIQNNFGILGIEDGASKTEIRDAFRKLALQHHSDKGGDIEKFKKTLNNIWHHLNDKGILIFDYWNGNSVITEKPSTKVKIIHTKDKRIIRIATPSLDLKNQSCAIQYHCIIEENSKIIDEFFETHTMRYY